MPAPAKQPPRFPQSDEENRNLNEALIMVAGINRAEVLDIALRDRDQAVKIAMAAYDQAVLDGLMEANEVDGQTAYRLSEKGHQRLAWILGENVVDGQHKGAL